MKDPLTIVNGTERTVWYPRRMDLPPLEGEHEANAGPGQGYKEGLTCNDCAGQCEAGKPCPRHIGGDLDWWPLLGLALLFGLGVPFAIAVGSELIQLARALMP